MEEIIFWFNSYETRNYWFEKVIEYFKKSATTIKYHKLESWIIFLNLKILFRVDIKDKQDPSKYLDKNQYWVEELFDNNFEEFLITFINKENKDEKRRN